jgi:glycosyltransferase involved in cell wall biosynthesis
MQHRIGFIIEQALGHITHGKNLQALVGQDHQLQAVWGLPAFDVNGLASRLPLYKSNWTVRAGLRTRRLLAKMHRQKPLDGLFFHTQVPAILAGDWVRRIPSVISLDATPRQYDTLGAAYEHGAGPAWMENWKWRLNRSIFNSASNLVTWSNWARQGLIEEYGISPEKITVIPPGVDLQAWESLKREETPGQPIRILFVGGDFQRKGGQLLLEAFHRLRGMMPIGSVGDMPVELHIVTRTPVPEEPGVFVYTHLQPNNMELKSLYFNSHIFCLPTHGDCLPMALAEAAATGLPLISTQMAAIPEIVRTGETGLLVPPGDVDALVIALEYLVVDNNIRRQFGENAHQLVVEQHDACKNAHQLVNLILSTIEKSRDKGSLR